MRIGIDLGGTKIEAAAVDGSGAITRSHRVPTPRDYDGVLAALAQLVARLEAEVGAAEAVGVGSPGGTSPATGLLHNAENTPLQARPFRADLRRALARPVNVVNDAHCFALSEAIDGAAGDARVVFGAVLGTGAGAGLVVDKRVVTGRNGVAGEWGHNPLPWPRVDELPGPPCYCGKRGCLEQYLSGTGLHREAGIAPRELARAAVDGDARSVGILERYADRLARALAVVINLIDPDVIVLGGGVSNITALYALVTERVRDYAVGGAAVATPIVPARHGDASGVRGAAWLGELSRPRRRAAAGTPPGFAG